jgi:hypothetical protein
MQQAAREEWRGMVKTFEAVDSEFAVATGRNVNSGPGRSTFDYPPNGTFNLVVTSHPDDTNPNLFELGETYSLSWTGNGGGTIQNATIIRSDAAPGGDGGIIVFGGVTDNGKLVHIVWAPGFDLEGWYWDNFSAGASPGFHTVDQNAAYSHQVVCFAAGTRISTPSGARPVEVLRPGDMVMTRDHGPQPVVWVARREGTGSGANAPVLFAPGSIGNRAPLRLSQQHRVLIGSAMAELMFAAPEVLVPARALIDGQAVRLMPCARITYVHLLMGRHEILDAASGAPCESLLPGDVAEAILGADLPACAGRYHAARPVLTYREALCVTGARLPPRLPAL